ncbi:MAG TPA: hypothetical protein VEN81_08030 [Planctomycetota bacterium]|nr:hypothetical protein [Planctomycetota bacterium]
MRVSVALLALAACGSPGAPAPAPPREEPRTPGLQAENAEWARVLQDLVAGRSLEEQSQATLSRRHYELGLSHFNRGDFDRAKTEAQEALRIWPENIAARRLLSEAAGIIVGGSETPRAMGESAAREALVATEQAQLEIAMHLIHGKRFFEARMYESAAREFEDAERKILHLPYDVKAMNELLPQVRASLARSKSAKPE